MKNFPCLYRFQFVNGLSSRARVSFGSVDNLIHMMEHDVAGQPLKKMCEASSDFALPETDFNTFRTMLHGSQKFHGDLHRHIEKENSVLFLRPLNLAAKLSGTLVEGTDSR